MLEQGQSDIDEFGETLRSLGAVDVRLLLCRAAKQLSLVTAVVNAGPTAAAHPEETYDYGHVVLIRAALEGKRVAEWLTRGRGEYGGINFSLQEPTTNCTWIRWASRTHATHGTFFPTPHTDYQVGTTNGTATLFPNSVLAGHGLPFFPDVNVAAASILFDVHSVTAGRAVPSEMLLVRIAHPQAYFEKIRVSPTSIVATVLGEELDDVHLQVTSGGRTIETRVHEPGDVRVQISGADSTDTWVALTRARECLDFRSLSSRWPLSLAQGDVFYEPDDLDERLDRIRLAGENENGRVQGGHPEGRWHPKGRRSVRQRRWWNDHCRDPRPHRRSCWRRGRRGLLLRPPRQRRAEQCLSTPKVRTAAVHA